MRPDYSLTAVEIILNDQAYRSAREELARWISRKQEADAKIAELQRDIKKYDLRLTNLAKRINETV